MELLQNGRFAVAVIYLVASNVGGLAVAYAGFGFFKKA